MTSDLIHAAEHGAEYVLNNWQTIGAYSVGGTSVAAIVHKIELSRGFKSFEKYGLFLLSLLSGAVVLANYLIQAHTQNPNILPVHFAFLFSAAILLHKFAVTPAGEKLGQINQNKLQPLLAAINQYQAEKKTATTTPEAAATETPTEFSL